jgi:hypothetical protein
MARNDTMIAALRREREVYVQRGLDDRVHQVDEQLEHYGYTGGPDGSDGPQGRTEAPKQTADAGKPAPRKASAKKTAAGKPPAEPAAEPSAE